MDLGLENQVVLVAASSSGLGAAVATTFAQEGSRVVICSRNRERINERADEIRQTTGALVLPVQADVTVQSDVDRLVKETIDRFGALNILVTNAAGPPSGKFLDFSPGDFEDAFQLNMMSTVRLCYAAVPHMLSQGSGSIVTITSLSVKQPLDNLILSNSIRLGVIGLTKSLANELGPKGIRVNSVLPGWTRTSRVEELLQSRAALNNTTPDTEAARIIRQFPLGRMATPEEFARVTVFLASPAASYVHGVAWQVDGGAIQSVL
ncbi:MAG: SDR family oxidoreductase [Anaerolineales bacterium]|nr:SDR family oxidoreductase [Anaerolineales bacterium]